MKAQLTPSFELTTDHPASHYGIPVLLHRQTGEAFGPADVLKPYHSVGFITAAAFVVRYGKKLAGDERAGAENFCRQWPDGPQF